MSKIDKIDYNSIELRVLAVSGNKFPDLNYLAPSTRVKPRIKKMKPEDDLLTGRKLSKKQLKQLRSKARKAKQQSKLGVTHEH